MITRSIARGFDEIRYGRMNGRAVLHLEGFDFGFQIRRRLPHEQPVAVYLQKPTNIPVYEWCVEQFGDPGDTWTYTLETFWFESAAHAVAFKVRWL